MRSTQETLEWYRHHETEGQLGYNPDGMCLMICRSARGIPSRYPSALSAQQATPARHRIKQLGEIRPGMVVFFDDPKDSNPYGHIVTVVGRVQGGNRASLASLLVRTNSAVSGKVVVVRGDYFKQHWGDSFQFAADWLNGYALDLGRAPSPRPPLKGHGDNLRDAMKELEQAIDYHRKHNNDRLVKALRRDVEHIRKTLKKFS